MTYAFGRMQKICRVLNFLLWIAVIALSLVSLLFIFGIVSFSFMDAAQVNELLRALSAVNPLADTLVGTQGLIGVFNSVFITILIQSLAVGFILLKLLQVNRALLKGASPLDHKQIGRYRMIAVCSPVVFAVQLVLHFFTKNFLPNGFGLQFAESWVYTGLLVFCFYAVIRYAHERQLEKDNTQPDRR